MADHAVSQVGEAAWAQNGWLWLMCPASLIGGACTCRLRRFPDYRRWLNFKCSEMVGCGIMARIGTLLFMYTCMLMQRVQT